MSDPRQITLLVPNHTAEKLESLSDHYLMPWDMIIQKIIVDRVDEIHDVVILEPQRKKVANE